MALDHGGHLTHGMKLNVSGKLYEVVAYHVRREDFLCDMDEVARLAEEHRPKVIVAGWSAYPRQLDFAAFREIADSVGAKLMVDMAHFAGLVAAGEHPNPVEHAHVTTTTVHKTLCGPRSGMIFTDDEELAKEINRGDLPGAAGRPADAHHRRQGGGARDRAVRAVPSPAAADDRQRARLRRRADRQRGRGAHRRHGRPPGAGRPRADRPRRQDRRAAARAGRDHRQPQRDPVRRAPADEPVRAAHRHPGADHPRASARRTCARSPR